MAKPVVIQILGDAKSLSNAVNVGTSALGKLGTAATNSAKAVGVAGAAIAVGAAKSAVSFEADMANVFTLLPDISGDAMSSMSSQVLDFSKELGILPDEVVPALYDALSAGVPQDNVFEFLEVAGQAAIGGNLEVAASVDLLSTAVNAYSAYGLGAAEASDLFFTTVRLGKTTVPELQAAFSNVGPVASALGVGLDQVGAAIAVLTASGVPTAAATTQIRGAIAELGKSGSVAAKAFEDITGNTLPEFIEAGGTFEEALMAMADSGGSIIDMFGSIEAAQGVMAITANGGKAMSAAVAEMANSAGATTAAFGVMDGTTSRSFDKIKANVMAVGIEIGNKLLPILAEATDWVVTNWPQIEAAVVPVLQAIQAKIQEVMPAIKAVIADVVDWVVANWPTISDVIQTYITFMLEEVWPVVAKIMAEIVDVMSAVVSWVIEHWPEISAALAAVKDFITDDVMPAMVAAFEWLHEKAMVVFDALKEFWDEWGDKITQTFTNLWEGVKTIFSGVFTALTGLWETFKGLFTADWETMWDGISTVFSGVWESLEGIFETAWELFKLAFAAAWEGLKTTASEKLDDIIASVKALPGALVENLALGYEAMYSAGTAIMGAIGDGIKAAVVYVGEWIWDALPQPVKWALEYGLDGFQEIFGGGESKVVGGLSDEEKAAQEEQALLDASTYVPLLESDTNGTSTYSGNASASAAALVGGDITIQVGGSNASAEDIGNELMWQLLRLGAQ